MLEYSQDENPVPSTQCLSYAPGYFGKRSCTGMIGIVFTMGVTVLRFYSYEYDNQEESRM